MSDARRRAGPEDVMTSVCRARVQHSNVCVAHEFQSSIVIDTVARLSRVCPTLEMSTGPEDVMSDARRRAARAAPRFATACTPGVDTVIK